MPDLFDFSADRMSQENLIELGVMDPPPPEEMLLDLSVELPHPDVRLVTIYHRHDGQFAVTLRDHYGVGHEALATGFGPDPLSASRSVREVILASVAARRVKDGEREKARDLKTPVGGRGGAAGTTLAGRAAPGRTGRPSSGAGVAATGNAGYTGSVPRNAALWEVNVGLVTVRLKPGLAWADSGRTDERLFPTVRLAKDHTRGAVDAD